MIAFVWIIIGLIGGWLVATMVKYSTDNIIDIIFGLFGGFVGAYVANNLMGVPSTSVYTFLSAICGAFIFIFLVRLRTINK